ncbi:unnamed protein product, partial [Laminaria digitata]
GSAGLDVARGTNTVVFSFLPIIFLHARLVFSALLTGEFFVLLVLILFCVVVFTLNPFFLYVVCTHRCNNCLLRYEGCSCFCPRLPPLRRSVYTSFQSGFFERKKKKRPIRGTTVNRDPRYTQKPTWYIIPVH